MAGARIGRRIIVTGLPGSGKSTLSRAVAAKTGLPLIYLDLHYWRPGWVAPSEEEWRAVQRSVLAGEAWVADGNYSETLDLRLDRADTVVRLDLPWWVCARRAFLRGFRMPAELPPGCTYTRRERLADEWRLAVRIWRKDRSQSERERAIIAEHPLHVVVHDLRSRRAVRAFLRGLGPPSAGESDIA